MKVGDLVIVFPDDPTAGIYVCPDPTTDYLKAEPFVEIEGLIRSLVLLDGEIYSVPTFQLEVINESR